MTKRLIDKDELLNKYRPTDSENQMEYLLYCMLENAVRNMPVIEVPVTENGVIEDNPNYIDARPDAQDPHEIVRYLRKKHNSIDRRSILSGRGIKQDKNGRWTSQIAVDHKLYYLGTYATKEEAVAVRKDAERLLWKEE